MGSLRMSRFLPLQVAAVCYRRRDSSLEFLLVNTTRGDKWTFPKGATSRRLSHSEAAAREAFEEAGAVGVIEPRHFLLYLYPKAITSQRNGAQEFVVKAFLMEVTRTEPPDEPGRNPTWFDIDDARVALSKGRELNYAAELRTVIDRAVDHLSAQQKGVPDFQPAHSPWRSLLRVLTFGLVRGEAR